MIIMYESQVCGKAMINALKAIYDLSDCAPIPISTILHKIYDKPGEYEEKELNNVLDFLSCLGILERVRPALRESREPVFKPTELFEKTYWNLGWHGNTIYHEQAKC